MVSVTALPIPVPPPVISATLPEKVPSGNIGARCIGNLSACGSVGISRHFEVVAIYKRYQCIVWVNSTFITQVSCYDYNVIRRNNIIITKMHGNDLI